MLKHFNLLKSPPLWPLFAKRTVAGPFAGFRNAIGAWPIKIILNLKKNSEKEEEWALIAYEAKTMHF